MNAGITETVIVDGRIVMKNGAFPDEIDENAIAAGAREAGGKLWKRMEDIEA
jgi:hypothetical protein